MGLISFLVLRSTHTHYNLLHTLKFHRTHFAGQPFCILAQRARELVCVCVFLFAENLYFRNSHDSICVYLLTHTHTYTLRHIRTHTSTHACAHVPIRMHVANAPQKSPEPIWGDEIMQSLCVCVCVVENASAAFGHRMIDMHM